MYLRFKRFSDFLFSALAFLLLLPIFIPLIILLRLTGEGDVFYKQERMGFRCNPFGILKFATMLRNSPQMGSKTVTLRNDPRITPLGKYLRITKLNELPQIINVLLGQMSLIGPRPLLVSSFHKYTSEVQKVIYQNRPGITGLGSVVFRDEEKLTSEVRTLGGEPLEYYREHIYPYKGALELYYFHHISLLTDVKILFATFWQILFSKSNMIYKLFPDLPSKPRALSVEGIRNIYKNEIEI